MSLSSTSSSFIASTVPRLCTDQKSTETVIATIVDSQVQHNDSLGIPPVENMTAFHSLQAPSIHIRDYVHRLSSYSFSSTSCLIAAFYYVTQAVIAQPRLAPSSLSVHRLLITALVLAAKFFDDVTYSMSYYAKVGGLSVKELAYLELKLLQILNFRLAISSKDFHNLEMDLLKISRIGISGACNRTLYCEAHHPDDSIGLWLSHPTPNHHMIDPYEISYTSLSSSDQQPNLMKLISSTTSSATDEDEDCSSESTSCKETKKRNHNKNTNHHKQQAPRQLVLDEGSGPLVRYTSSTSTVTSEASTSTEGGMCSDGGSEGTPTWECASTHNIMRNVNYRPDVYCRFRGPITTSQWNSNHVNYVQHRHHHHQVHHQRSRRRFDSHP